MNGNTAMVLPAVRHLFNAVAFTEEKHAEFMRLLTERNGEVPLKVSETPVFLPCDLVEEMIQNSIDIVGLCYQPEIREKLYPRVPEDFRLQNPPDHPAFLLVDYALVKDENGDIVPKLIELQAMTAHFAYLASAAETFKEVYNLGDDYQYTLGGATPEEYRKQVAHAIVGNHDPKHVVLLEIDPEHQKTRMDFVASERMFGIRTVDITEVEHRGTKLYYKDENGEDVVIERIYSRIDADEFARKGLKDKVKFKFTDQLDVEWVSDPVWQFLISKAAMPYIDHPVVPKSEFLDKFDEIPKDLENYVLKPLFAMGGRGVQVDITRADIDAIPQEERGNYMLMKKVEYAPVIRTPDGDAKVEVRIMLTWDDVIKPAIMMGRIFDGKLASVGVNDRKWLGLAPVLTVDERRPANDTEKAKRAKVLKFGKK